MTQFIPYIAAYFCGINVLTWILFWSDKRRAGNGHWRIPESRLLTFAALGGSPAAKLAQKILRHKTRKRPFIIFLNTIIVVQIAGGLGALYSFNLT